MAVLKIADETLQARILWADGKYDDAIQHLQAAVAAEDALKYDEPPQWVFPVRQSLGGAYLALGGKPYAEQARRAFCADLAKHPKNARSFYGLARALGKLDDAANATLAWQEYQKASRWADQAHKSLTDDALWLLGMPAGPQAGSDGERAPAPPPAVPPGPSCPEHPLLASPG